MVDASAASDRRWTAGGRMEVRGRTPVCARNAPGAWARSRLHGLRAKCPGTVPSIREACLVRERGPVCAGNALGARTRSRLPGKLGWCAGAVPTARGTRLAYSYGPICPENAVWCAGAVPSVRETRLVYGRSPVCLGSAFSARARSRLPGKPDWCTGTRKDAVWCPDDVGLVSAEWNAQRTEWKERLPPSVLESSNPTPIYWMPPCPF